MSMAGGARGLSRPAPGDALAGLPETGLGQLIYSSSARCAEHSRDMARIREVAPGRNARLGLTGFLHREDDMFFQCLEGGSGALREIMALLESDPRHHDMRVLAAGAIPRRRFEGWAMGFSDRRSLSLFDWIAASSGPERSRRIANGQDLVDFLVMAAARARDLGAGRADGR